MGTEHSHPEDDLAGALGRLRSWELFGGAWRVLPGDAGRLTIALCRCDDGAEVERLHSDDPALAAFVGDRTTSAD